VTEVLIGLLRADPASYLSLEPDWVPTLPPAGPRFGLVDLLTVGDRHTPCHASAGHLVLAEGPSDHGRRGAGTSKGLES
jgi:hypothetical protein